MMENATYITAVQKWLDTVIIEYNLCPFAKRERDRGSIRLTVNHETDIKMCLFNVVDELTRLDYEDEIETTLIIYPNTFADFDDYLDFLALADDLLIAQGYEGIYQLASFHPNYCFSDVPSDDASNYTNRSPYPLLHLIRESSIERAMLNHPNPDDIPERNIQLTRQLGLNKLQSLLAACYLQQ